MMRQKKCLLEFCLTDEYDEVTKLKQPWAFKAARLYRRLQAYHISYHIACENRFRHHLNMKCFLRDPKLTKPSSFR